MMQISIARSMWDRAAPGDTHRGRNLASFGQTCSQIPKCTGIIEGEPTAWGWWPSWRPNAAYRHIAWP